MTLRAVMLWAVAGAALAVLLPSAIAALVGCHVGLELVSVIALLEVVGAAWATWYTYTQHEAAASLSWRVAHSLAQLDGSIVWAVHRDGTVEWSVGRELVKHWPDIAPDGIQVKDMHLRHFGDVPARDAGLERAWRDGSASWVVDVVGITWMSWARKVAHDLVVVHTQDASQVATLARSSARHRIIAEVLGEVDHASPRA